jgi:LacI family transcriptional regulator
MNAFKHYGIERVEKLIVDAMPFGRTDEEAGKEAMKKLLARQEPFTAVIAINDLMALGACRVLYDCGFSVPQDVSVIGCDNIKLLSSIYPSLSSIDTHPFETGRAMMNLLIEYMQDKPRQTKAIIANFIQRDSVSVARTGL